MLNPIKEIAKWQKYAGNAARPYEDFLESSFQISSPTVTKILNGYYINLAKEKESLNEA